MDNDWYFDVDDFFGVEKSIAEAYEESLKQHIAYVHEAGKIIGANTDWHDESKWTRAEFPGYAMHFHGGGAPNEFAKAWLHHIHHNPHHWQHWIFPDGYTPKGSSVVNGLVEMPKQYALEMIADWLGAGRAYIGDWDMSDWLDKNIERIQLHPRTAEYVVETLDHLGYADIVYMKNFDTR